MREELYRIYSHLSKNIVFIRIYPKISYLFASIQRYRIYSHLFKYDRISVVYGILIIFGFVELCLSKFRLFIQL